MSSEPVVRYRRPRWSQIAAALFGCIAPPMVMVGVFGWRPWWVVAACFLPLGAAVAIAQLRGWQMPDEPTEAESP